jgi:pyruvate dehydrogenase E2 component (dihydrolipoamide acetyltransferase)
MNITVPAWEDTTIEEAALTNLFVSDGSTVRGGQVIGELLVEKATVELAAPADGVIQNVKLHRGDVVKPGMLVAELVPAGEAQLASVAAQGAARSSAVAAQGDGASGAFTPASPAARRLARELGVEIGRVVPADGQRITEEDVRRAVAAAPAAPSPVATPAAEGGEVLVGRRKVIAERMLRSVQSSAQLTLTTDVRADALIAARERARQRLDLTYTDLLAWITIQALKQHPAMNATLDGDRLRQHAAIHLGLAVAVPDGLLVPVVRDAGGLSLAELAERSRDLTERARNNSVTSVELSGSTFSLTTLGVYEIDAFTPILNTPEVGILGIGRIREAIIPQDGLPVLGHMLALSLTFDHRAIDGAPAAAFLQTIKQLIESANTYGELQ